MRTGTGVSYMVFAAALGAAGFAACFAASFATGPALAQSVDPCLGLPTDAERLVCMRDVRAAQAAADSDAQAALAAQQAAQQAVEAAASPPTASTQVQTRAGVQATPAPGQSAADRCLALPTDAERLSCMRDALAIAEAALAAGQTDEDDGFLGLGLFGGDDGGGRPDALMASQSEFATGFGAEQLAGYEQPDLDVRLQANIVAITERVPGIHQFELDNGQVWRQLTGDTQAVRLDRNGSHPVELYGSWAGGYRMSIPSQRQTVLVERIR